jgi:hypothetical protein
MLALNRTSSNAFAYEIKNTSNWVNQWATTVKQTSNSTNWLNMRVRTDSNAFAYQIKNSSNAIVKLSNTTGALTIQNSNWINQWASTVKQTSNSVNIWIPVIKSNSNWINAWASTVKQTSNTANYLSVRVRTDSNALLALNRANSNALLALNRANSNALLFGDRNNSNSIIRLGVCVRTNSNAFAYEIKNSSNAIVKLSNTTGTLVIQNSNWINQWASTVKQTSNSVNIWIPVIKSNSNWINAWASTVKQTSNTANYLSTRVRTDSNALLALNKANSNALLALNRANSNALLALNRANSNALLFGDRNNSNAIIKLGITIRTNSNAFAYAMKNASNTANYLSVRVRTDSNAMLVLNRTNSNALLALNRTTSNALLYSEKTNSNAIISLSRDIRYNSNALIYLNRTTSNALLFGDRNNSNAIIKLTQNGPVALSIQNSNAIVSWVKDTSNAVIKLSGTAPAVLPLNNSNAIVKLNAEIQSIDHGPTNININAPVYFMLYDIYISVNHTLNFASSCTLNGNGHMIHFAKDSPNILTIAAGRNVVLTNVVLKNFNDSSVQLGTGATLTFGDGCRVDLADEQIMSMPWVFAGDSILNGCGNGLEIGEQSIQVDSSSNLTIENVIIEDLANNNISCASDSEIIFDNDTLQLSSDYHFASGSLIFQDEVIITGTNTFSYETNKTSTIDSASSLMLDSGVTFNYAPSIANRDLIAMQDITSQLYLNGCTLISTTTGLRLTVGTLTVDGENVVFNNTASLSQATCFGNGISDDDLNIDIKPGGSINIASGILDYQNVN